MASKKPIFTTGEIYHIYNRGVEKRDIFTKTVDYLEMIHDLYDMNDVRPWNFESRYQRRANPRDSKDPVVEIFAFVLMPNHYHLLLRQTEERGITTFMQKLGTGYTMYFNKSNERVGPLFQGPFKAIHVDHDDYLQNLVGYIHTNPINLVTLEVSSALNYLRSYRWSSFPDYLGIENFSLLSPRSFIFDVMGGKNGIEKSAINWLMYRKEKNEVVSEVTKARP